MKKLKILFLSPEVFPFARTGGLGDVASALPKALKESGHEVRIMMPKYKVINERKFVLREVIRLKDIPIIIGDTEKRVNVKSAFTPDPGKIQTYFIDYRPYFAREGLYIDVKTGEEYTDNDERFILFCKGVFETLRLLFWQPDIIHCNDWQTALVPFFLKTLYKEDPFFQKTATLLTVHNVAYQGNFPPNSFEKTNVDGTVFSKGSAVEYYDRFSFLKSGIYYADYLNTVSPTYAKEVQESKEYGRGFEGIFADRRKFFSGILNGVDYDVWNPEKDELIPYRYSANKLSPKIENKKALLERCALTFDEDVPVIGMIARLTDQKGCDLIRDAADMLYSLDFQFVLLGTGDEKHHTFFRNLADQYPERVRVHLTFDDELAHLIEAGCDIFLMPSRFEPCGLNQLFSMKYGTVPVVRKTGGLADSVKEFSADSGKGTGFVFEKYQPDELVDAVRRALSVFKQPKVWKKLMKNGMRQDYSWKASAKKYYKIYEKILKR